MLQLLIVCLFGLLAPLVRTTGSAMVIHHCDYPLWCARVQGYLKDDPTPSEQREKPHWMAGAKRQPLVYPFYAKGPLTSLTIMCTRDPNVLNPRVTQLEFYWEPNPIVSNPTVGGPPRVWWDVSNVEGHPFIDEGFQYSMDLQTPYAPFDKCIPGGCPPGVQTCQGVYDYPTDDVVSTHTITVPDQELIGTGWHEILPRLDQYPARTLQASRAGAGALQPHRSGQTCLQQWVLMVV